MASRVEDATKVTLDAPTLTYVVYKEEPLRIELTLKAGHAGYQSWQSFEGEVHSDMVSVGLLAS